MHDPRHNAQVGREVIDGVGRCERLVGRAEAGMVGGSGGGRPDFAQAGGKDPEKLDGALQAVYNIVAESIG